MFRIYQSAHTFFPPGGDAQRYEMGSEVGHGDVDMNPYGV